MRKFLTIGKLSLSIHIAKDLWQIEEDGTTYSQIFALHKIDRDKNGLKYSGWQFIFFGLNLVVTPRRQ
jgi:hypothetical protein